ncbi:MAG: mechanosensitive ion channel family protein [Candidatus Kapaibacterium sp.]
MKKSKIPMLLILLLLSFKNDARAQVLDDTPEITLETPHNTIYIHLRYLQKDVYAPEKAARALQVDNPNSEKARNLAVNLKKILDGRGLIIDLTDIPKQPDYTDTVSGMHIYRLFPSLPEVYLKKYGNKWLYSEETVEAIPDLYKATYPLEISPLVEMLPAFSREKFLGLYLWQYFGFFLYVSLAYLFYRVFSWIFGYFVIRVLVRFAKDDIASRYIKPIARPLSFLLVLLLLKIFIPLLRMPVETGAFVLMLVNSLFPVTLAITAFRLTDFVGELMSRLASKTKTTIDDNIVPMLKRILKVVIVIIGAIYFLEAIDIAIIPLLAGLSIGGLAFALAAQDTIKHFFGSITIFTDQPFEIGDWIIFDGGEGTVEHVGMRSTRVRTFYNSLISIPNGKLADAKVDNMGRRKYRRYSTNIAITYDTPPDLIEAYVEGLKKIVEEHPATWKEYYNIYMNSFGDSSLNILFYIFFDVPDWSQELKARHEVILQAIRLADELGVRFAYPTQTLHMETFPGKESLTPAYKGDKDFFINKMNEYFNKKKN